MQSLASDDGFFCLVTQHPLLLPGRQAPAMKLSPLRLCIPRADRLFELAPQPPIRFTGPLAPVVSLLVDTLKGLNLSVTRADKCGSLIPGSDQRYDGCLGSLQANESDLTNCQHRLPIFGDNLAVSVVQGFERMGILSAYNRTAGVINSPPMLAMFAGFPVSLWLLISAALLLLLGLRWISVCLQSCIHRVKRRLVSRGYPLIACLLKQHSGCSQQQKRNAFYGLKNLLCILLTVYLTSGINSTIVLVTPPSTITSYADILKFPTIRPVLLSLLEDGSEVRGCSEKSFAYQVWKRAEKMAVDQPPIESSFISMKQTGDRIAAQQEVLLLQRFFGPIIVRIACTLGQSYDDGKYAATNPFFVHDPSARERLTAIVRRQAIPDAQGRLVRKLMRRQFESDFPTGAARSMMAGVITRVKEVLRGYLSTSSQASRSSVEGCCVNKVDRSDPGWAPVSTQQLASLAALTAVCLAAAVAVAACEYVCPPCVQKRKKVRRGTRGRTIAPAKRRVTAA